MKWLSVVDEFTRECLILEVARRVTAEDVKDRSPCIPWHVVEW